MVALDACHTKNKKYPTLLFLATTVVGNNKILVLAYALRVLEDRYPNGKEAVQYIWAIDPRKFSRYALQLPRYGRVTSNAVECMNDAFLGIRVYDARRLIFELWKYMMKNFYKRRTAVEKSIEFLTKCAKGRISEFEEEYGRYVTFNAYENNALVQSNGGAEQWIVKRHPRLSCSCFEPQEMLWPCIHAMSWCKSKREDYLMYVDRIYFQKSLAACYSEAIPPITEHDLQTSVTCRAPEAAVRRGRARTVRIPNGGGSSKRRSEYMYHVRDEPRMISSQGPRTTPQTEDCAGPSTEGSKVKGVRRCGICREIGHRRDTCQVKKQADALRAQYFQETST
ncbi:hypothetical protein R1sor_003206 [Riccia sorocarpa]|uniref:SWIM-type domain-containing protein n=1 Tax=Riccia sorocarpa TaxID=122646 RepID=A0ABD3H3R3_9MARC